MVGNKIKQLRLEKEILQKELADKLNLTQQTISLYESGKRSPDYEILKRIADYFNVSTDYLLNRDVETIAAHKEGEEFTEDELKDIEEFKNFVRSKRNKE